MDAQLTLTELAVRKYAGERSYDLGQDYLAEGAVNRRKREGATIRAQVQGTANKPYAVRVHLACGMAHGKIESADCSCPVGSGACKHVAAVLLAWCKEPDSFRSGEPLDRRLNELPKEELVALVRKMIRRRPELEALLEAVPPADATPSVKPWRAQADAAFESADDDWGYFGQVAGELRLILESADELLAREKPGHAQAVYQGVVEAIFDQEGVIRHDEAGHLFGVIEECTAGLERCLKAGAAGAARRGALWTLFQIVNQDIVEGGISLGDAAYELLLEHARDDERAEVAAWAKQEMNGADGWARESYKSLVGELEGDQCEK
jgi:uncharacterized Zn finger protein